MKRSPDRRSPQLATRRAGAGLVLLALISAAPAVPAAASVTGIVLDRDTGEPIEGAWVFEAVPANTLGADVQRFDRVEVTRSDAQGEFAFPDASGLPVLSLDWWRSWFVSPRPPRYPVYHPGYGLVWGREAKDGAVRITLSLREAHLRSRNAMALCVGTRPGAPAVETKANDLLRQTVRREACPPADPDRYANGRLRARGEVDARGRRHGPWRFYRADGSLRAEGHYHEGAATGDWTFHPTTAR